MKFFKWLSTLADKIFYNAKWTCNACGKEIFEGEYFCEECKKTMPYNNGAICNHCGRKTTVQETYCLTCKNNLPSIDIGRSHFVYAPPISTLIKKLKYNKKRYVAEIFCEYLAITYFKHYLVADIIVYPPMTKKSLRKREYNHAKLLAEKLSEKINIPVVDALVKTRETDRQAKLNRNERLKNLIGAFRVSKRKEVENKTVLLVDDVTTTGATAEVLASRLKMAGAKKVILLTVASVPSDK